MKTAQQRIASALNSMPYGGGLVGPKTYEVTLENVASFLESLGARLLGVAASYAEDAKELHELRQQREAIRAFLGLTGKK